MLRSWSLATMMLLLCAVGYTKTHSLNKVFNSDWKLELTEKEGAYVSPEHKCLVLSLKKNHSFKLFSKKDIIQEGQWDYEEQEHDIVLDDAKSGKHLELDFEIFDNNHVSMQHPNNPDITMYFSRIKDESHYDLNHLEHIICKTWYLGESAIVENEGSIMEFNANHTFSLYAGSSKYDYNGTWTIDTENMKLYIKDKYEDEPRELDIVEIHSHKLSLRDKETKRTNTFYDDEMIPKTSKGNLKKIGAIFLPILLFFLIPA